MATDRIIQVEFEGYIKAVYDGLAPESDQYEHLRGAFFAGAQTALRHCLDGAIGDVSSIHCELREFGRSAPIANRVLSPKAS